MLDVGIGRCDWRGQGRGVTKGGVLLELKGNAALDR